MKFTFTCKKIALNDSIKEYAEKKISKLDRYFPEEADAFVTFAVEKKNRCVVELTIRTANGTLFRAQEEDPDGDMRGAINEAVAFIERRIRKNKTRLARNLRPDAPDLQHPRRVRRGGGAGVRRGAHQALRREAHDHRGGHSPDEPAGPHLLCVPQHGHLRRVRGVPPQQRRLRPHRDPGLILIYLPGGGRKSAPGFLNKSPFGEPFRRGDLRAYARLLSFPR